MICVFDRRSCLPPSLRRECDRREFVDLGEFGGGFEVVAAERGADVIELAGIGGEVGRPAGAVVEQFNLDFGHVLALANDHGSLLGIHFGKGGARKPAAGL